MMRFWLIFIRQFDRFVSNGIRKRQCCPSNLNPISNRNHNGLTTESHRTYNGLTTDLQRSHSEGTAKEHWRQIEAELQD